MELTKEQLAEYGLRATMAERERCAKIVEGEVYKHRYRTWPLLSPGQHEEPGNRSEDSDITKHCHKLAAALRGIE